MGSSELSDVAWDLVDHCRAVLTIAELNTAFVRLGVGDYSEAMVIAMKSMLRAGGPPLPAPLLDALTQLSEVHFFDQAFLNLVAAVTRADAHRPRQ